VNAERCIQTAVRSVSFPNNPSQKTVAFPFMIKTPSPGTPINVGPNTNAPNTNAPNTNAPNAPNRGQQAAPNAPNAPNRPKTPSMPVDQ
jgi:hypothetical protein